MECLLSFFLRNGEMDLGNGGGLGGLEGEETAVGL